MNILRDVRRFFMLSCQDVNAFLAGYLEGTLDDRTRVRFEQHIARCPQCAPYLEQYRATIALAKTAGAIEPKAPPDVLAEWTLSFLREHYDEGGNGRREERQDGR